MAATRATPELNTQALDEAFERLGTLDFELPNGFVNHGPMACEALEMLGQREQIDKWARAFERLVGPGPAAAGPVPGRFDWSSALGDYQRLPEWMGYFAQAVSADGWAPVAALWVPRLLPGLATVLFHGAIRTAQALRAVSLADTEARRAELARALAYWAARYRQGRRASKDGAEGDIPRLLEVRAAEGARRYLSAPTIIHLHGITGALAVRLLVDHVHVSARPAALAQVRAELTALYRGIAPADPGSPAPLDNQVVLSASTSGDPHQVKLVEACRRGLEATGDLSFAAAARAVTGL